MITETKKPEQENSENAALLEEMMKAGLHFGHLKSKRHPKMEPFIFGIRNNISIINVQKTYEQLKKAADFLKKIREDGGTILFVNTKPETRKVIEDLAKKFEQPYITERWLGGTLTNFKTLSSRLHYYEDLLKKKTEGQLEGYTKKERLDFEKEIKDLGRKFAGLRSLKSLPQAVFIVDIITHVTALKEAQKTKVPVVAIVDTNANPEEVQVAIPANDDSYSSVAWIIEKLKKELADVPVKAEDSPDLASKES